MEVGKINQQNLSNKKLKNILGVFIYTKLIVWVIFKYSFSKPNRAGVDPLFDKLTFKHLVFGYSILWSNN